MDSMSYIVKYKKNGYPIFLDEGSINFYVNFRGQGSCQYS